ncbi:MAG: hypothetical protein NTV16_08855 [Actinobacteria bacterium]|nr:hypothetical protein [Actinomycetota bacterium]
MMKNKIKRISIIGALVVLLAGGLGFGIFRMIAPLPVFGDLPATAAPTENETQKVNSDTDNIQDENLNSQDDSQEANGAKEDNEVNEVKGATETNEAASVKEQGENLLDGGHQDQDNVDHQFEGVE